MRFIKQFSLALIAVFALGAATASVASAESAGIMMLPDSNEGAAGMTFSFASTTGERWVWETVGGKKIECTGVTGSGTASSDPLGSVAFKVVGCEEPALKVKCQSGATTGEIAFTAEYHYRYLLPSPNSGVQMAILLPTAGIVFKCSIVEVKVKGCVSSMDLEKGKGTGVLGDELVKSFFVNFLQEKGIQKPTSIDNEAATEMVSCVLMTTMSGKTEESGQLGSGTVEKFEKAKVATEVLLMH
jgi:hypothetical protein